MELESGIELSKVQVWTQLVFWSRTGPCATGYDTVKSLRVWSRSGFFKTTLPRYRVGHNSGLEYPMYTGLNNSRILIEQSRIQG
jgi:hypothetical protein